MATITYTGWNGLLSAMNLTPTSGTLIDGQALLYKKIARAVNRPSMRRARAIMRGLSNSTNAAGSVGDTISSTYKRVSHSVIGGVQTIETVNALASAASTSTQQTEQNDNVYDDKTAPSTYPTEASGNGGGGQLGR